MVFIIHKIYLRPSIYFHFYFFLCTIFSHTSTLHHPVLCFRNFEKTTIDSLPLTRALNWPWRFQFLHELLQHYFISRLFYYVNTELLMPETLTPGAGGPVPEGGGEVGPAEQHSPEQEERHHPLKNITFLYQIKLGPYRLWNTRGSKCSFVWKPWLCQKNFEYFFQTSLLGLEDRRRDTWSVTKEMTILWRSWDRRQRVPWRRDTGCLMKNSTCHLKRATWDEDGHFMQRSYLSPGSSMSMEVERVSSLWGQKDWWHPLGCWASLASDEWVGGKKLQSLSSLW